MKILVEIDTENDAFRHPKELSRILFSVSRKLAGAVLVANDTFKLQDYNGNTCGRVTITGEEDIDHE